MSFDYAHFPIPVEKVSKKVQMVRYKPCQNSLGARQFDSVVFFFHFLFTFYLFVYLFIFFYSNEQTGTYRLTNLTTQIM